MDKDKYFKLWEEEFYDPYAEHEILEECLFESVAIGFFIAKGVKPNEALNLYHYCIEKRKY